ncbi:MAG: response regulator, partial [Firmicutes bacterium]|nr:response regulator [Bacillota bacterium]
EAGTVWLRVGGRREGDKLSMHIEVEDTGMGIKEEDIPKLFEAYQRIEEGRNRKIEGTGLGINITVQLLKMMGSELKVHSIYGKGSKFYFDVYQGIVDSTAMGPFDATSSRSSEFVIDDDAFTAPDANILVVDDNAMNRKVFRSLLKRSMAKVDEADSGKAAISKVEQQRYDVIFMDHMMPEMDGIETMKRMREEKLCDDTPIYVLTANAVTGAKEEYMALGFDGYLAKPVAAGKLEEALRETLPDELKHPLTAEERAELESAAGQETGSAPAMPELPDVEGLDWSYAWLHLPSEEMLRDGVESFYDILGLQADKLSEFYEGLAGAGDDEERFRSFLDEYRIQVHGMKSAAATIGIVPLAGMAKMLEFAAKDGKAETIEAMHETFINEWNSYKEKLRGVFGLGTAENAAAGDTSTLETMFEMLVPAMEDLDVDTADEIMEKMKGYTFGPEIDDLVGKLNGAVKNLDEDETKGIIEQIRALF